MRLQDDPEWKAAMNEPKSEWKPDDVVGRAITHEDSNGHDEQDIYFDDLLPEVQAALNGKSESYREILNDVLMWWENALNDRCEVTSNAPYCYRSNGKEWKCASHIHLAEVKAQLADSNLQIVDGQPVREGTLE